RHSPSNYLMSISASVGTTRRRLRPQHCASGTCTALFRACSWLASFRSAGRQTETTVIAGVITWIKRLTRTTAGLVTALIVLGLLLAVYIAAGGFMTWHGLQVARERELPMWIAFINPISNLLVALILGLGILAVVQRLLALPGTSY